MATPSPQPSQRRRAVAQPAGLVPKHKQRAGPLDVLRLQDSDTHQHAQNRECFRTWNEWGRVGGAYPRAWYRNSSNGRRAGPAHSQPHPAPTNSPYLRAPDTHQTWIQHARNPVTLPLANPPPHRVHRRLSQGPVVCYSWHPLPTGRGPCHTTQSAPAWVIPYSMFQHNAQPAKTEALLPSRFWDWRRGRFGRGETPPPIPFSRALCGGPAPGAAAADLHAGWRARSRGHRRARGRARGCARWPAGVASGCGLVRALAPTWL